MEIPKKIRTAAKWYIEHFGERLKYLATEGNQAIYYFAFPKDCEVGFPVVFLFDGNEVKKKEGIEACNLISKHTTQ